MKRSEGRPRLGICGCRGCTRACVRARSGRRCQTDRRQTQPAQPRPRPGCGGARGALRRRVGATGLGEFREGRQSQLFVKWGSRPVTGTPPRHPQGAVGRRRAPRGRRPQPSGASRERPSPHAHTPRGARARWQRRGWAARRRRPPRPGAAAGAAPGSHGRRQVLEPRAGSPQSRADGGSGGSGSGGVSTPSLLPLPSLPGLASQPDE